MNRWTEEPDRTPREHAADRAARIAAHSARLAGAFDAVEPAVPASVSRRGGGIRGQAVTADRLRRERAAAAMFGVAVGLSGLTPDELRSHRRQRGDGMAWRRALVHAAVAEGIGKGAIARALGVAGSSIRMSVPADAGLVAQIRTRWAERRGIDTACAASTAARREEYAVSVEEQQCQRQ